MEPANLPEVMSVSPDTKRTRLDGGSSDAARFTDSATSRTGPQAALPTPNGPDSNVYAMNGLKRGKVLIFNHFKFDERKKEEKPLVLRHGTDEDVKTLSETLPKLGFLIDDIKEFKDCTKKEIWEETAKLKNDVDLKNSDSLIVVILTHGEQHDILWAKDEKYCLYDLVDQFKPSLLCSMAGKPKIFIVEAPRGDKKNYGVNPYTVKNGSSGTQEDSFCPQIETFKYPEHADLMILMSSHHGHTSNLYGDPRQGSWFIQQLCSVIEQCDPKTDSIIDIAIATNSAVSKEKGDDDVKQISSFYSTFTKQMFFDVQH